MTDTLGEADDQFQLGMEAVRANDYERAAIAFQRSIDAAPDHSPTHANLGSALAALERHDEAIGAFRQALETQPPYPPAHYLLGLSLRAKGRLTEAEQSFANAVDAEPDNDGAHYDYAMARLRVGDPQAAFAHLQRAVQINPTVPAFFVGLAAVFRHMGNDQLERRSYEYALDLDPSDDTARTYYLARLAQDCDFAALETQLGALDKLGIEGEAQQPFPFLSLEDRPDRHRKRSEHFVEAFLAVPPLPARDVPEARPERLKIGYFSSDFHDHATMYLAARLFELHDRGHFETFAYSFGDDDGGAMRKRAEGAFDHFRDMAGVTAQDIARQARADGIDIAIDLKGYTAGHLIEIFAHRPAPVQVSYLGYPGTSGAPFIDYLLADPVVVPDAERDHYSEALIRLPHSYQPNDALADAPSRGDRAAHGLPADRLVLACFNNSFKIGAEEFGIWMTLLRDTDGAVLWLLDTSETVAANLRSAATAQGVDPDRLVFAPRVDHAAHIERLALADLVVDTFNYNAHTTASDALRAGVPVVTRTGRGFAARVATSLLHAQGLEDFAAATSDDYAAIARRLLDDPAALAETRKRVEAARETGALFDSERTTRALERGLDAAYERYLAGNSPEDILVGDA